LPKELHFRKALVVPLTLSWAFSSVREKPWRTDRSILKVIVLLFGPVSRGVAACAAIAPLERCNTEATRKALKQKA
jgi:hypothetical protein